MPRTIPTITAELDEMYRHDPALVRIAPEPLQAIEAAGGTFDFFSGRVWLPYPQTPRPQRIVGGFGPILRKQPVEA